MKECIDAIKYPVLQTVTGIESLGLRDSLGLFFDEFSRSVDRKMAIFKSTVHDVNYAPAKRYLESNKVLFVRNAGVEITVPEYFGGDMGEMNGYVRNLINGIFIINGLKTETLRLYNWLKEIVRKGRVDKSFYWAVTDFDSVVAQTKDWIKELNSNNKAKYPLDQVYLQFEDAWALMNQHNNAIKSIKGRDIEIITRDITAVYELGSLLCTKIEANDLLLAKDAIGDLQQVINKYTELVNVSGAVAGLLNELAAVFTAQCEEFKKMK